MDADGVRCFQIMEALNPELLQTWVGRWADLVDFEIISVLTSSDFWAKAPHA